MLLETLVALPELRGTPELRGKDGGIITGPPPPLASFKTGSDKEDRNGHCLRYSKWVLTEVRVVHGLLGRESFSMIVTEQLVQKVQRFSAHQLLVLTVNVPFPSLARVPGEGETPTHNFNTIVTLRLLNIVTTNTIKLQSNNNKCQSVSNTAFNF